MAPHHLQNPYQRRRTFASLAPLVLLLAGAALLASLSLTADAVSSCSAGGNGGGGDSTIRRVAASSPPKAKATGLKINKKSPSKITKKSSSNVTKKSPSQKNNKRRHRSLLQQPGGAGSKTASANGAGYSALGEAPIAITHSHLLPGTRDQFLVINYFDASGSYPPGDGVDNDGRTMARVFDRSDFSFGVVPVATNAVCGAWASLPDGRIGMYAGHVPMGVQPSGFDNLYVFSPHDGRYGGIEDRGGLSRGRWYPGVCALPSGRALVYGGSTDVDFFEPHMDGDVFSYSTNALDRTAPMPEFLSEVAYGPYYPLLVSLPGAAADAVLVALNSRAAVVVPQTGELLAQAPPFPEPYADLVFEYPMAGSLAMLAADERLAAFGPGPGGADEARVTFAITGGVVGADWYREYKMCTENRQLRPCSDGVLTIGLTMRLQGEDVQYAFDDAWSVATMAPRCVHDAVLLPNGKLLIINGVGKGYAGLGDCQLAHDPHNEAWIYDPATNEATPAGGASTRVPRLYHGHAALTARGDVLVSGTTNTKGWENSRELPLDESPFASDYRVEIFTPAAIAAGVKRPAILRSPTTAYYGAEGGFEIVSDEALSSVVIMQPGGATHGMALAQRAQRLSFERANLFGGGDTFRYRVAAPARPRNAPEGHFLLFGVAADGDAYSEGAWLLLREGGGAPLATLPAGAVRVAQASTDFEAEDAGGFQCGAPCEVRAGAGSAGTGDQGARLVRGEGGDNDAPWSAVLLASGDVDAAALADDAAGADSEGAYVYVSFWARSNGGDDLTVAWADVAAVVASATETDQATVPGTRATAHLTGDGEWRHYVLQPVQLPRGAGQVRLVIGGAEADVDDVEAWASGASTVVNAAFRSAMRSVRQQQQQRAAAAVGAGGGGGGGLDEGAAADGMMGAQHHVGGVRRNERFLSPKARAFGVFA